MKYVFIVNPNSGQGNGKKIAENIKKVVDAEKLDYEIRFTSKFKDIKKFALEYKNEENIIFGVGGDGLVSEVASGIIGTKNILGIIPAGTGNDLYRTLKQMDSNNEIETIDIGKVNDRYFINTLCVGIDAETANNLEIFKYKKIPNKYLYNVSMFFTFFRFKFKKLKIEFDDKKIEGEFPIVSICNGKYYGGGYKIAPNAKLNDGKFELYYADKVSKIVIPPMILKLKKGKHENIKIVHHEQIEKITITSENRLRLNVDGELLKTNKADIEIIKKGIKIYKNIDFIEKILNYKENKKEKETINI